MVQRKPIPAGMLNDFITCVRPTEANSGNDASGRPLIEDEYGDISVTNRETVATFWGHIEELKPTTLVEQGKKRLTRIIKITAREQDTDIIELDDEITFGNSNDIYQINDYFESDWRYGREFLAEYKN